MKQYFYTVVKPKDIADKKDKSRSFESLVELMGGFTNETRGAVIFFSYNHNLSELMPWYTFYKGALQPPSEA